MDKRTARKLLTAERERLQGILASLQEQTAGVTADGETFSEGAGADQHPADVGTETFELEKDMSIRNNIEAELADIERALRRVDDGTYGTCEACGRKIPQTRLQAIPATRFCVKDQSRAEREARIA
jgi:RNA polymerase-binding transcription factor DksA